MSDGIKKVGKYRLVRRIGSGATAEVFQGRHQDDNKKYAIKMIKNKMLTPQQKKIIQKEVSIVKSIQHPNIVKLFNSLETTNHYYLIFQFCQNGDLEHYLKKSNTSLLAEKTVQKIMYCLSSAVQCIHSKGIVHRDIKLANILLTQDLQIKLADFGFAKETQQNFMMNTYCGSPITMAPQILNCLGYNMKCDIWSLGIILYQLVYGKLPFTISNGYTAFVQDVTKKQLILPKQPSLSKQFQMLIFGALQKLSQNRYSINQFYENKWIQQGKNVYCKNQDIQQKAESVGELLRSVNNHPFSVQIMKKTSTKDSIEMQEKSVSLQYTISYRIRRILYQQLEKLYSKYQQSRDFLQKQIQNVKSFKFMKLLRQLDYGFLNSINSTPISICTQTEKQQFSINYLKIKVPKAILYNNPHDEEINCSILLLQCIKDLNQSQTLEYKKNYYEIMIQLLELMKRFSFKVQVLFPNHHSQDLSLENVVKILPKIQPYDEDEVDTKIQGNFVTIALEVKQKNEKMREYRENIKRNISNRIHQIQKQINGW